MTRPTKEAVDDALAVCDRDCLSASAYPVILADEVRALREEADLDFRTHVVMVETLTAQRDAANKAASDATAECYRLRAELAEAQHVAAGGGRCDYWRENRELKDTIARVEAVGEKWRLDSDVWTVADYDREIAGALRGES